MVRVYSAEIYIFWTLRNDCNRDLFYANYLALQSTIRLDFGLDGPLIKYGKNKTEVTIIEESVLKCLIILISQSGTDVEFLLEESEIRFK